MAQESKIEREVCRYAEAKGFLVRKYNSIGVHGAPDRILFGYGRCFFIEFKAPDGVLSPMQEREIARIREAGTSVFVVSDTAVGRRLIDCTKTLGENQC